LHAVKAVVKSFIQLESRLVLEVEKWNRSSGAGVLVLAGRSLSVLVSSGAPFTI
jgi:hypothetical protein